MWKNFHGLKEIFLPLLQGLLIGTANIIPGVSGGTVAFILGIYPKTLQAIANVRWQTAKACLLLLTGKDRYWQLFKEEMRRIEATFLISLMLGADIAVCALSFVFSYLLTQHREATYSFFFGLVLISIVFPCRLLQRKSWKEWTAGLLGIAIVVIFTIFQVSGSGEPPMHQELKASFCDLLFYFFAGIIAICAMILPGISGSFMLLLLGVYFNILYAIELTLVGCKNFLLSWEMACLPIVAIALLTAVAAGCALGMLYFARLIAYLLKDYYNPLMAFLIGLLVGSLYGIWPFREVVVKEGKSFYGSHRIPELTMGVLICAAAFLAGCLIVFLFYLYEGKRSNSPGALWK